MKERDNQGEGENHSPDQPFERLKTVRERETDSNFLLSPSNVFYVSYLFSNWMKSKLLFFFSVCSSTSPFYFFLFLEVTRREVTEARREK